MMMVVIHFLLQMVIVLMPLPVLMTLSFRCLGVLVSGAGSGEGWWCVLCVWLRAFESAGGVSLPAQPGRPSASEGAPFPREESDRRPLMSSPAA